MPRSTKSLIYTSLKLSNDLNAIRRGRVPRRVARRVLGRTSGRAMRKLLG